MNFQRTGRSVRNVPVWASDRYAGGKSGNMGVQNYARTMNADSEAHQHKSNCNKDNTAPQNALSMVYAPYQKWKDIFDPATSLAKGTIFEELYKPFCPCSNRD